MADQQAERAVPQATLDKVSDLLAGNEPEPEDQTDEQLGGAEDAPEQVNDHWQEDEDLGGEDQDEPDGQDESISGEDPDTPASIETFEDAAEALGMTPKQLYGLTITNKRNEQVTLGQLKDAADQVMDVDERASELDARQTEIENAMIKGRAELNNVMAMLPQLPETLLAEASRQYQETIEREHKALLMAKPEWRDEAVYERAQSEMLDAITPYGFRRADLDAVIDHRLKKLVHDFARLKQRVAAADAKAKEVRRRGKPRRGQGSTGKAKREGQRAALVEKAKQTGERGDQVAAVSALLNTE